MKNKQQNTKDKAGTSKDAAAKGSAKTSVRDYYEAESWQFSGCGD